MYNHQNFLADLYKKEGNVICYNLDILEKVLLQIKSDISVISTVKLFFAIKSNTNINVLKTISKYIDGYDCGSYEEYLKVKKNKDTIFSINGPSFAIKQLTKLLHQDNVIIDFDNLYQLKQLKKEKNLNSIGIRIKTNESSRFGLNFKQLVELSYEYKIDRMHFHQGTKTLENLQKDCNKIYEAIKKQKTLFTIKSINLGGGFDYLYSLSRAI